MTALWSYFWPLVGIGLVIGTITGLIALRAPRIYQHQLGQKDALLRTWRRKRRNTLAAGLLLTIAGAALWHAPLGAADAFASRVERNARETLDYYEMFEVTAKLHRGPLTRRMQLTGPANDFQRSELVRIMGALPGVGIAHWLPRGGGVPLAVEGGIVAVLGFLVGLLLAYLVELRRRYNAQWSW